MNHMDRVEHIRNLELSQLIRKYSEKQKIWSDVANRIDAFIHFYEGDLESIKIELEEEIEHLKTIFPIRDRNKEKVKALSHWVKIISLLINAKETPINKENQNV